VKETAPLIASGPEPEQGRLPGNAVGATRSEHRHSEGEIAVVDYGIGNLRSAEKALVAAGAPARLVSEPEAVASAAGVVVPGVGAFGSCARALRRTGFADAIDDAARAGKPVLGICVGLQLFFEGSEEDPSTPGLGLLEGVVRRLPAGVKHPQMQWNQVWPTPGRRSWVLEGTDPGEWFYFVHSFAPESTGDTAATCDYGGEIVAVAERGNVAGVQFHPEKSSRVGLALLNRFAGVVQASLSA
jgi:glutamine amidotransferase